MPPVSTAERPRRSVLLIGSEAQPFAKTGGLADVLGALPPALQRLGWDATVVLPRYRGVSAGTLSTPSRSRVGGYTRDAGFYEAPLADGARAMLVDCPDLFDRQASTASTTPTIRTARAALRFWCAPRSSSPRAAARGPSVVHAHDWQAGLAPVYLRTLYASHPVLGGTPSVFTIHNLAYQGVFEPDWLPRLDLRLGSVRRRSARVLRPHQLAQGRHQRRAMSITTVSRALRPGDPDAGVRLRLRRHPARARGRSGRHPERHRHRASGIRRSDPFLPAAVRRRRSLGQARRRRRPCSAATACRRTTRRCGGRSSAWCRAWSIRKASI